MASLIEDRLHKAKAEAQSNDKRNVDAVIKPSTTGTATGVRAPAASATSAQFQRAKDTIQQNAMNREMNQLQRQRQQAQVDLDVDTINRLDRRMKEIRAAQGRQTVGDRASDTLSGAVQSYGAGVVNAVGTVANSMNDPAYYRRQIASLQKRLEAGGYSDGRQFVRDNETVRQKLRDSMREMADKAWQLERPTSFVNRTYQLADRMQDDSARSIANAKKGAGALGQLAVDVGVAGGQMGMDALTAALTGGSALVPMAVRSFGGGAQEARRNGADLDDQLLYGAGSAALSVGTEKISNIAKPFKKMFGAGAAETIAGSLVKRFGENGAVQMMRQLSQSAAGRIALSAIGEGGEEVVEDVLQPFLKRATYDPGAKFDAGEAGRDFLVGAILGGLGGVPETVGSIGSKPARNQAETGAGAEARAPAGVETARAETGLQGVQEGPGTVPAQRDVLMEAAARGGRLEAETAPVQQKAAPGTGADLTSQDNIARYRADIDKVFTGEYPSGKVIMLGETPGILQQYGAKPLHMTLTQDAAYKIAYPEGYFGGKHNLGMSVLKQLPYQLANPVAVLRSASQNDSLVIVTAWKDGNTDIIIPLHLNKQGSLELENRVASAYGKGHIESILGDRGQNVLYTKNNEDIHQLLSKGVQFPQAMADDILAKNNIPQTTPEVKSETDPLIQAIFSTQKRVDQSTLSPEQFSRLAELNEQGTVGMDADGRVYQVDPEEHIDRRGWSGVGGREVNAFQYDHPELAPYYRAAAQALAADLDQTERGGQIYSYPSDYTEMGGTGYARTRRHTSREIGELLDAGMSYARIEKALDAILQDHGAENYADAKRVELLLDRMLTDGYRGLTDWTTLETNEAYIREKGQISGAREGGEVSGYLDGVDGLGAADAGSVNSAFERMQAQTDTFHPINESAARRIVEEQRRAPSEVPATNPETGRNITKTVSTILNSPLTSPEMAVEIERAVADGKFDYIPVTDKSAVQRARADITDRGLNRVADEFLTRVDLGQRIRKNDITAAMECYNQALAAGDGKTAFDLAAAISEAVHDGAQVTQAMNLMNRLTPEGRLLTLRRYVDKLNRETVSGGARKGVERAGDTDAARADFVEQATGFRISDELATEYLMAETDAERSAAWDAITTDLAARIPSTFREKANFWRYTSMLLNPTTHVRNILGNGIQAGARTIKNGVGAAIERAVIKDQTQRTKAILAGKEGKALKEFARGQYAEDQDASMGAGKYSDASAAGIEREIQSKRKAFQGTNPLSRGVQAIGDFNTRAMDTEDVWFNRPAYVDSFAQALKAKGVTAAEAASGAKADLVAQARAYAIEEARRATYRNTTALSEALSGLGSYRGDNPWKKIGSFAADAFMPFRRTPANILTTGMDYSPLGLVKAAKEGLVDLKRGDATAADVVDSLSAGLTGTGLMALGAWLAAEGLLRVSLGDDDREEAYNKDRGAQKYALQIGGRSYTLDWASPSAMPLLAGASVMESAMDGGSTFEAVMDAMTGISDVVLETSMLSSLNDLISNWSYADNKVTYVLDRAASGYLGQYVPTAGGKIASLADDTVRKSYVETGTGQVASDVDYFLQGVEKKIPGARNTLRPKIDLWGEDVSNGNLPERVFKNFLSPGNLNTMDSSALDRELRRLEESVGSSAVYPAAVGKSFTVNGERKELTAEEYTKYARKVGQTRRQLVEELMNSEGYKKLDDANRAAVIASAYEYAGDLGKMEVSGFVPRSGGVTEGALKSPLPTAVYLLYRNSSDRDGNDSTSAAESTQTLMELDGLTDKERGEAWSAMNNKGETEESRERKEAKNPFTGVLAGDYSPEKVMAAWGIFDGKGTKEKKYTQERKKKDLQEELEVSAREANDLYTLMKRAAEQ